MPRWVVGGVLALVLAQVAIFVALAPGAPSPSAAAGPPGAPALDEGVIRPPPLASPTSPSRPCRAAGGTCVGLEAGACARGTIGDAARFACGSRELRCCLPPPAQLRGRR